MKPFLSELAEEIFRNHGKKLDALTIVFPNRRAALYFRKHLTSILDKPSFSPKLITIEDFIAGFSVLQVPEKIQLIHLLQRVYESVLSRSTAADQNVSEPFDQFYFWGEMLLRDFDEADKYMATSDLLFRDLSHQKEIDSSFDFLSDEQREFLRSFWLNFDEKDSVNKEKFLRIWRQLPSVYNVFKASLQEAGLAYDGMLHRDVAENIHELSQKINHPFISNDTLIYFVGFNALTKAEEKIISYFVQENKARVKWDVDDYYFNNQRQEAGRFFREYSQHRILGRTMPTDIPANLKSEKEIKLYGATQPIGQAKLLAQVLKELLADGADPEDTLIVLADEKLLMPVLHGVAGLVDKLNVTMGFPLSSTPLFNFVELLVELQLGGKSEYLNHRAVVTLLGHPYVVAADPAVAQAKRKKILHDNWVSVPESFLRSEVDLHRKMFTLLPIATDEANIIRYIRSIVQEIGHLPTIGEFDKEYCFHFVKLLNKMEEVIGTSPVGEVTVPLDNKLASRRFKERLKSFLRLFRQLLKGEKIPFSGEPLKGLQVMGVLETRNLDFKNVFILSLNEGSFPSFSGKGSYIPYNIRKAYGLPTVDQQDSMYAYLFYRCLQRAENIFLFHNSETDDLGQGEMSRYLQQLLYESGLQIETKVLHNDIQLFKNEPVSVVKDDRVFAELATYCTGPRQQNTLTPSALNDYIECRLKFYFKYVSRIREAREVEEELDARVLGNFLHRVMELFYQKVLERKGNTVEIGDFDDLDNKINSLIDAVFIKNYELDPQKKVVYEGQWLVVREIVKRFAERILKLDKAYAPFSIEALEKKDLAYSIRVEGHGNPVVILGGSIDRADKKNDVIRVIDYKTGKDELQFPSVESLFVPGSNRNKAAFQTLLYTLLYKKSVLRFTNAKLIPGLMNRNNLFSDDFAFGLQYGKQTIQDATPLLPEFEAGVKQVLTEIFDPQIPFDQTTDQNVCRLCSYRQICYR